MEEKYDEIINLVKNNFSTANDKHVQFSDSDYKAFDFDKNNFKEIKKSESKNKIAFVDGGSSEIIKSPNFSLNIIRLYCGVYLSNKRVMAKKYDFYAFAYAKNIDNELFYEVEFISKENSILPVKQDLILSSQDETLKNGISRASISTIANLVRRFSEIKLAKMIIDDLNKGDIIVLDGSLQCNYTNERKYLDELYGKALEKNIVVCGLSKTTSLMTDGGNSISNALNKFDFGGKWVYHPVADITSNEHKAEMAFVKLHEISRHIFRFEIHKEQKESLTHAASLLSENCKDPVFLGYPYGLIDADRNARVSNQEKDMLLTLFSVKFGKDWEKIRDSLSNADAHGILDNIS